MAFPPAPWRMRGQAWLSVFRLPRPVDVLHPAGVYAVALVDYQPDSPLTYHELLVARAVGRARDRRLTITDIWVDSPDSRDGGRSLWAIPKHLAGFEHREQRWGPLSRARWSVDLNGHTLLRARFVDASRLAPRLPFRGGTWQPPIDDHVEPVATALSGSARALPCWGAWDLDTNGPLGWLAGRRPVASFRMVDFAMSFGDGAPPD
ncbi:MAG TPA: acetoacetate decarboxylase family protein [Marmoricola sp.]|nr:acetoacetate decarboxylase family protein [Marmoricola sp.]